MNDLSHVIVTENLTKIYDEGAIPVKAVNNVNLKVDQGEFTALVGPSGSGKTTLLNLIGGLDKPTSGNVWVDGKNLNTLKKIN